MPRNQCREGHPPDLLRSDDADIDGPVARTKEVPPHAERVGRGGEDQLSGDKKVRGIVGKMVGDRDRQERTDKGSREFSDREAVAGQRPYQNHQKPVGAIEGGNGREEADGANDLD